MNDLIPVEPTADPVITAKRRKLALIEKHARRFRRIDIQFLAIAKSGQDKPLFALLPIEEYDRGSTCSWAAMLWRRTISRSV